MLEGDIVICSVSVRLSVICCPSVCLAHVRISNRESYGFHRRYPRILVILKAREHPLWELQTRRGWVKTAKNADFRLLC